jgi:hypothetical protein
VCCGTKRQVEVRCPADCGYLSRALAHPPAAVVRQRDRDARFIMPLVHELSELAYGLLLALQGAVKRYRRATVPPLIDADVAEAAGTLAATLETASRGIIYEHQAASLPAQRLVAVLRQLVDEATRGGGRPGQVEREAAVALRRIERAAGGAAKALGAGPAGYLDLLERLPSAASSAGADEPRARQRALPEAGRAASPLILP